MSPVVRDGSGRFGSQAPVPAPTPLAAPAGITTGYTAGATPGHIDGTSTGGQGQTAYTIGDLVAALKQRGFIAP